MGEESDSGEDLETLDRHVKVVVLGDGASGKTSIIMRFAEETFNKDYNQTIGIDFFKKRMVLPGNVEVLAHVWDIGGQTLGGKMLDKYLYGCQAVMFVYDITNYSSFEDVDDWLNYVKNFAKSEDKPPHYALVGNKIDLAHLCTVRRDKHENFAQENSMSSHFISAKSGDSVNQCLLRILAAVLGIKLTYEEWEKHRTVIKADLHQWTAPLNEEEVPSCTTSARRTLTKDLCRQNLEQDSTLNAPVTSSNCILL